jgi:hypothetical protein
MEPPGIRECGQPHPESQGEADVSAERGGVLRGWREILVDAADLDPAHLILEPDDRGCSAPPPGSRR